MHTSGALRQPRIELAYPWNGSSAAGCLFFFPRCGRRYSAAAVALKAQRKSNRRVTSGVLEGGARVAAGGGLGRPGELWHTRPSRRCETTKKSLFQSHVYLLLFHHSNVEHQFTLRPIPSIPPDGTSSLSALDVIAPAAARGFPPALVVVVGLRHPRVFLHAPRPARKQRYTLYA